MQSSQLLPLGSLLLSFATPLAQADALHDQASALFKPIPEQVTELRGQPISEQQRELGKKLFFDPRLSRSHVLSCNTCHNVGTGGADNVPTSVGHGWQKGPRNSPTVFNAVFNAAQFWDGRAKDLGEQAKGPIQNSVEMHRADSTGRRNTFDHGGVYGTTCRVDAEVDGARGNALTR
ncbi:cytochrome-c peroxidase, partial [Pseudomonas aeruginosa]|uniref:cytochrome-c peroxidase n=1 Tax=Pseudomonas aeruginosa TaxID=287 RepID=UPI00279554FE